MFWYLFEELADFYKVDHEYHEPGTFFAVWAKGEKEATKTAEKWASDADALSVAGRYKTMKATEKGAKSRGKKYKSAIISFGVKDGTLISAKELIKLNESFKVNSPTLNKLVNMEYSDPRQKDGCKIVAEKGGSFRHGDDVVDGSYIMYQDNALPGKFVAVHVSDSVNEETDEPNVAVVAIGNNKQKVMQNMAYRMRRMKDAVDGNLSNNE